MSRPSLGCNLKEGIRKLPKTVEDEEDVLLPLEADGLLAVQVAALDSLLRWS